MGDFYRAAFSHAYQYIQPFEPLSQYAFCVNKRALRLRLICRATLPSSSPPPPLCCDIIIGFGALSANVPFGTRFQNPLGLIMRVSVFMFSARSAPKRILSTLSLSVAFRQAALCACDPHLLVVAACVCACPKKRLYNLGPSQRGLISRAITLILALKPSSNAI